MQGSMSHRRKRGRTVADGLRKGGKGGVMQKIINTIGMGNIHDQRKKKRKGKEYKETGKKEDGG